MTNLLKKIKDDNGKEVVNPQYTLWINDDGLLTTWLLLSMIIGAYTTFKVWSSLEE